MKGSILDLKYLILQKKKRDFENKIKVKNSKQNLNSIEK